MVELKNMPFLSLLAMTVVTPKPKINLKKLSATHIKICRYTA